MGVIYRGPLGGGTNTPLVDPGTQVRTRSSNPGAVCVSKPGFFGRTHQVRKAWEIARSRYVREAIIRHTREDLYNAIHSILPGLLYALGIVIATSAVGALVGSAAGGVGAAPGAAAGFGVGMAILEYLGLGFLVVYFVENAYEFGEHILNGTKLAWRACGDDDLDPAAKEMAEGVGIFFSVVVQAVIAMVLKKGLSAAVSKVSKSELGPKFGDWVRDRVTLGGLLKAVDRAPGDYLFSKDGLNRTVEAEGWLVRLDRGPYSEALRASKIGQLVKYHLGHLIPRVFGGPPIPDNLTPIPEIHNLSYIKVVENLAGRYLQDGRVYLKVSLRYDGESAIPSTIQHRLYRMGKDGMEMIPGGDITTNVGAIPSRPMGQVVNPRDFLSPDPKRGVGNGMIH